MPADPDDRDGRGRLPVRVLVIVLVAQLLLAAVIIWFSVNGWPFIGGHPAHEAQAAPDVPARFLPSKDDGVPTPRVDRFDAAAALALAQRQVRVYGPRPAGSASLRRLAADLRRRLPQGRLEPVPGHPGLSNVVGRIPGRMPAIVLGAHYDTNDTPANFVGANDGAAGTAVLVGVADALRRAPRPRGAREIRFALFDGEEAPAGSKDFVSGGLRGSRAYVAAHRRAVDRMILLDYVGARGLQLPREGTSARPLWSRLRDAARRTGTVAAFPPGKQAPIYDDHTPFLDAGIPAIDLIDWGYPWVHVSDDTLDKLSTRSLDVTGETVTDLLLAERRR